MVISVPQPEHQRRQTLFVDRAFTDQFAIAGELGEEIAVEHRGISGHSAQRRLKTMTKAKRSKVAAKAAKVRWKNVKKAR